MYPLSRLTNLQALSGLDTTTDNTAECFHSLDHPVFKSLSSAIKKVIFGKSLLVYLETIRQVAKLRSRARSNTMLEYLQALSLPEPFSFFLLS